MLVVVAVLAVLALVLALILLFNSIVNDARRDETAPADAIIVLGAAQWNGRPSTALRARLDHAADLYAQGLAPTVVLTGGIGEGDRFSEAEVGRDYLANQEVPARAMETVAGSTTWESLGQAATLLTQTEQRRVLLVSDAFHMFRVKRMAEDLGLEPLASPTSTSPIKPGSPVEYRYMAREAVAYLAYLFFER